MTKGQQQSGRPPKRHHTLPRFWLRGFTNPDLPPRYEPFVFCWDARVSAWTKRSPKNATVRPNYYSYRDLTGHLNLEVETGLAMLESVSAPAIRALLSRVQIGLREQMYLAHFVALLMLRVPFWQDVVSERAGRIGQEYLLRVVSEMKANPKLFAEHMRRWREIRGKNGVAFSIEKLEQHLPTVSLNKAGRLGAAFAQLEQLAEDIYKMDWEFAFSQPPDYLIASDNPVGLTNASVPEHVVPGVRLPGTVLTAPLARNLVLIASRGEAGRVFSRIDRATVARVNLATADFSHGLLFSPKKAFPGTEAILKGNYRWRSPTVDLHCTVPLWI